MKALRKKLILMYILMSGGILTILFGCLILYTNIQNRNEIKSDFINSVYTIKSKLKQDSTISDTWLVQFENDNDLIVRILDNGNQLFFTGAYQPATDRDTLIESLDELAVNDGFQSYLRPISSSEKESETYIVHGNDHDQYYGLSFVLLKNNSYLTVHLLKSINIYTVSYQRQIALFVSLNLLGIVLLFLVSRFLVDRSLRPVKKNQQRQTEFIAAASHELRSPLAVIRANNSADSKTNNAIIENECVRMSRLINDMLLLASGDSHTWKLNLSTISIETLILTVYENAQPACQKKGIAITLSLPDSILPEFVADYDRILQVMTILTDNAISYSESGTSIELGCKLDKKSILLWVQDHGIGIPEKDRDHVFDRFYRVDSARNNKNHFGLGLSIAKELVSLHHGTIQISDTNGGGTTFTLRLPLTLSYQAS